MRVSTAPKAPLHPEVGVLSVVPERWGGMWLSRQQILTRLARHYNVVWVDPALGWRELWLRRVPPVRHPDPTPPPETGFSVCGQNRLLPRLFRPSPAARYSACKRIELAARRLRRMGSTKTVLYVWRPEHAYALDCVQHDLSCYHIADEYSFEAVERPTPEAERRLIERVDHVFVHSPALMEKKGRINPHSDLVTNGVDFELFSRAHPEPADLAPIPRPRIGYVGRVKVQLDWEAIDRMTARRSDLSFVFVGPTGQMGEKAAQKDAVFARPNVYYLGHRPVSDIPAYTQHIDVGLLCYEVNAYTRYIFPLKLHEYLAAGIPVVGADLPSLRPFGELIDLVDGDGDWDEAVSRALDPAARSPERISARRAVAAKYDWSVLSTRIASTLGTRLGLEPEAAAVAPLEAHGDNA